MLTISLPCVDKMILQPEGKELDIIRHKNGKLSVSIPRVDIHSIIEVTN